MFFFFVSIIWNNLINFTRHWFESRLWYFNLERREIDSSLKKVNEISNTFFLDGERLWLLISRQIFNLAQTWAPNSIFILQLMAKIEFIWKCIEVQYLITIVKVTPSFLGLWFWVLKLENCVKSNITSSRTKMKKERKLVFENTAIHTD